MARGPRLVVSGRNGKGPNARGQNGTNPITYMYIALQCKTRETNKNIIKEQKYFHMEMTSEDKHIFKYHYPKGNRMIEQKVAG